MTSKHVGSITDDCESCHNESSALTINVNGCDLALGECGDLHVLYGVNCCKITLLQITHISRIIV